MPGPSPQPTALKIARGNPGRRPLNDKEAKPLIKLPPCPSHLSDDAAECWGQLGRLLANYGLLADIDAIAFELLCDQYAVYKQADKPTAKSSAFNNLIRILKEFGLTPAARSRIVADPPEHVDHLVEKFLG